MPKPAKSAKPAKTAVNVTELRQNLPAYLAQVQKGTEIEVTSRGKVIARIVTAGDAQEEANARIIALRGKCVIGDVTSPSGEKWKAEQ